jgi:hypothetical protein
MRRINPIIITDKTLTKLIFFCCLTNLMSNAKSALYYSGTIWIRLLDELAKTALYCATDNSMLLVLEEDFQLAIVPSRLFDMSVWEINKWEIIRILCVSTIERIWLVVLIQSWILDTVWFRVRLFFKVYTIPNATKTAPSLYQCYIKRNF